MDKHVVVCNYSSIENKSVGQEVPCNKCNALVWLSDTSLQAVKENAGKSADECDLQILCIVCGIEFYKQNKDSIIPMSPTQDQLDELKDLIDG